jgi:rod shape-determining protein MreD
VSYYIGVPLVFLLALVEASVLPLFRVGGLQPNLLVVLFVAWLMLRGPSEAFVLIPFGGLMIGLVDGAPLGTALLALSPLAIVQEMRGTQLRESGFVLTVAFVLGMTLVYHFVYLLVYTAQGDAGNWIEAFTRVIIPTAVLNVVVLLPIYAALTMSSQELRRASYV